MIYSICLYKYRKYCTIYSNISLIKLQLKIEYKFVIQNNKTQKQRKFFEERNI